MNKHTRNIISVFLVGLLVIGGYWYMQSTNQDASAFTIGAILPLSGPAALWGEQYQRGMTLAREELQGNGTALEIVYKDSEAKPATGVSAYRALVEIDNADAILSIFSRVSVPLISLAHQDQVPFIMSMVSASGVSSQSPYAFRYYAPAAEYVRPHFETRITKEQHPSVAVLYINDEYGVSVRDAIRAQAARAGTEIVLEEGFQANTTDFRALLTKVKASEASALLSVTAVPSEITSMVRQFRELAVQGDFFDMSVTLSAPSIIASLGDDVEGAYTDAFSFTLNETGEAFRSAYKARFKEEPLFAAALGYDVVHVLQQAYTKNGDGPLNAALQSIGSFAGTNGTVTIQDDGEINPSLMSVKIKDGVLRK